MPWLNMPKPEKRHVCKKPRWVGWWRKDRDLWGCKECGYIYQLRRPAHPRRRGGYVWVLEDSRGWNSPSWEYLRKNFISRADEKKMTMEEYDKLVQGFDFNEYRWLGEVPPGGKIV